jgi:light-regulated signal transduction histidine kinase (bacteriophytochrome)
LILDNIYGEAPEKMRTVLERVQTNGKHLLGLINDVLDLSKIEAGQLMLSLADYSLADLVQGVYVAVEPLAARKDLELTTKVARGLPVGHGDERRLAQVLLNLVGDAIKFTEKARWRSRRLVPMGHSGWRCATAALASRPPIRRKSSKSSSKWIARRRARKAERGWGSRFPSVSSKCTAVAFWSIPSSARGRLSRSDFP